MTDLTGERLERWRGVQPRGRRGVLVPVLLWLLLIVLATVLTPDSAGCTLQEPCGSDWTGATEVGLALAAPALLLWVPALGAAVSLLAAAVFLYGEHVVGGLPWPVRVLLPVLVVAATVEADVRRRARDARARALLEDAPTRSFPGPVPPLRAWTGLVALGAAAVVGGLGLLGYGLLQDHAHSVAEDRARRVTGTVVAHGADGYLVTVAFEDRTAKLDTLWADDYPVGSRQVLLVSDEVGVRLAVERYDASGWLFGSLLVGGFGLVLLGRRRQEHAAVRRVLTEPVPVHRVRVGWAPAGAQLLPAEGDGPPLLSLPVVPAELPELVEPGEQPAGPVGGELYGVPRVGEVCALVLDSGLRLLPDGRARRGEAGWEQHVVHVGGSPEPFGEPGEEEAAGEPAPAATAAELAAWRAALTRPQWWRVPLGVLLVAAALTAAYLVARGSDGLLTTLWRCSIAAVLAFNGLAYLVSRVRLTPEALVHEGPTTRRTVPWGAVRTLTVAEGDVVLAWLDDDEEPVVPLTWLPRRPWWRRARRRTWARQWAAVLAAEARAGRGPTGTRPVSDPRLPGALVAVAFTAAVLLGLWSRGQG